MKLDYDRLNTADLRGTTRADYLIALDATLRLQDGGVLIYEEPSFPVVELARSLQAWLDAPDPGDFEFDSMSFEEVGSLRILRTATGWTLGSVFVAATSTRPVDWSEIVRCCRDFIGRVERDLRTLGLDPDELIRP